MNFKHENNGISFSQEIIVGIARKTDEALILEIEKYCREEGIIPYIIPEEKLKLILELGINRYNQIYKEEENDNTR